MCSMLSALFIGGNDGRLPKPYKEHTVPLMGINVFIFMLAGSIGLYKN